MSSSEQWQIQDDYWNKRIKTPRNVILVLNGANLYFQVAALLKGTVPREWWANVCYTVQCFVIFGLMLPSLWSRKYNKFVRFGFMLCSLRQILFIYNVDGMFDRKPYQDWIFWVLLEFVGANLCLSYHLYCFNNEEAGHFTFSVVYLLLIVIGIFMGTYGAQGIFEHDYSGQVVVACGILAFVVVVYVKKESLHQEHLDKIFKHIEDQKFLKLILDTHKDCLLMLNKEGQITFCNSVFQQQFSQQIRYASKLECSSSLRSSISEQQGLSHESAGREGGFLARLWRKIFKIIKTTLKKRCLKSSEKQSVCPVDELAGLEAFGSTLIEQANFQKHFFKLPLLRNPKDQMEEDFRLCDIADRLEDINDKTFAVLPPCSENKLSKPSSDTPQTESRVQKCTFLKLQATHLTLQEEERYLLQLVDVSETLLNDQFREQNEMLSILNATVSHELRNPLNSIVGQNVQKEGLYEKLDSLFRESNDSNLASQGLEVMELLRGSLRVQESSIKMMSFLVQDFLDFAQIKSGKFRVNLKQFDILETIEKVMSIQKEKAEEAGIKLTMLAPQLTPGNIRKGEERSSFVITDEQRVMQVLLNLQSNALKFTQKGSVIIHVGIDQVDGEKILRIAVSDTGIGIPEKDQDKLFKLFGFVSSTQQYNKNGIGLGLVISERIVKKFGGEITFESVPYPEVGHGTTFTFTFRLGSESELEEASSKQQELGGQTLNSKHFSFSYPVLVTPRELLQREEPKGPRQQPQMELNHVGSFYMPAIEDDEPPTIRLSLRDPPRLVMNQVPEIFPRVQLQNLAHEKSFTTISEVAASSVSQLKPERKRILIVDDQIFNIQALKAILLYKFNIPDALIDSAFNGQEALDMVKDDLERYQVPGPASDEHLETFDPALLPSSYCLILMDCNMPFMDGFECSRRIRELFGQMAGVGIRQQPLITAVTGHAESKFIRKCFDHGMNQVVSKPVDQAALLAAVVKAGLTNERDVEEFQMLHSMRRQS